MKFNKTLITASVAASLLFTGFASAKIMNMGIVLSPDSHYGKGAKVFAQEMNRLSDGKYQIKIKSSGVLGGERDVIEGLQFGTVDLTITSTGPVGNFVPEVYALDFPFLFKSYDHAHRVLDGKIGNDLLSKFEPKGLIGLAWGENGFRHLTNSQHAVNIPADLAGLKLRTMENEVHMSAFKDLKAAPTPMSFTEVFTALQQGTVDGQENPIPVITTSKLYEVQEHLTLTGHIYSPAVVLMSKTSWSQLNDTEKQWFKTASQASAKAMREAVSLMEKEGIQLVKDAGVKVVENVDKKAFADAIAPTYKKYSVKYGAELIESIQNY